MLKEFFAHSFGIKDIFIPISPANLALFIAYLYHAGDAASTINTYVSSVGYFHRIADVPDPTKVGYILELLRGYGRLRSCVDTHLPVTIPILRKAFDVLPSLSLSHFQSLLFKSMSFLAVFAFLRIGEITSRTDKDSQNSLQLSQVLKITNQQGAITSIKITFHNFKHSYNQPPISLVISRQQNRSVCPVQLLLDYLQLRGPCAGPLFLNEARQPVSSKSLCRFIGIGFSPLWFAIGEV